MDIRKAISMNKSWVNDWLLCPYCGTDDIKVYPHADVYFGPDSDVPSLYQSCMCDECDKEWIEVYTQSHREDLDGKIMK
jgi:hypothetical protein